MRLHAAKNGQKGLAAVEFALAAPILLLLLFGIFEFGSAFWRKQVLTTAVRDGARKGVVATVPRKSATDIDLAVRAYLAGVGWDPAKAGVTIAGAGGAAGTSLTVTATYPTNLLILSRLMPGTFKLDGSGNMTLTAMIVMQME